MIVTLGDDNNPCRDNRAGCSSMCIPVTGMNFTCACPEGQVLKTDQRTCFGKYMYYIVNRTKI